MMASSAEGRKGMGLRRERPEKSSAASGVLWLRGQTLHPDGPSAHPNLDLTPKTQPTKAKVAYRTSSTFKTCLAKGHVKRIKRQATDWEKINIQ